MEIIASLIGLIFFIACCVTISRIGEIRDDAKRQTELLRQIAQQTKKEGAAQEPSVNYLNPLAEEKSAFPPFLLVLLIVIIVLIVIAMAMRR